MQKFLKFFVLILIAINLIFCAWYVLHNDINFHTDIARDFLLLSEISDKKLILLGPRSSTSGLFHGPLWLYLNYPAYVIGQGNPIVVGWYWILLIGVFLGTSFVIAKKLFNETTAYLFTLLLSVMLIFEAKNLFNPHGAFFLLPAFFFFFIRTLQTLKPKFLLLFFLIAGCIIQFQMAIGIPLLLLSLIPIGYQLVKKKKKRYLFSLLILLIPLSTFILFDLKHQFIQFHSVLAYVFGNNLDTKSYGNVLGLVFNRLQLISGDGFGLFRDGSYFKNQLLFLVIAFLMIDQIKKQKHKLIYLSSVYFFVGYYLLSLVNKSGGMLYHYCMPLFPLIFLIFASFSTSRFKKTFGVMFFFVYVSYLLALPNFFTESKNFIGKDQNSWAFLSQMAQKVYVGKETELGYFLYMPDSLAYQPKYAVLYASRHTDKTSFYFQKKPITYVVIAPPPADKPGMQDGWWKTNQLHLNAKPVSVVPFANGYKIEKYALTPEEMQIPFDPAIDTGIHFR